MSEKKIPLDSANVSGMAVTVTLVFSDESHREAWLRRTGVLEKETRNLDYERRKGNTNLIYTVGVER